MDGEGNRFLFGIISEYISRLCREAFPILPFLELDRVTGADAV